jgi:hypothetical protein
MKLMFTFFFLIQTIHANNIYFTLPLPTNENPCACVDKTDIQCDVIGFVRQGESTTGINVYDPCMCWSTTFSANKTIDVVAYCRQIPNTVVQLQLDMKPSNTIACAAQSAYSTSTCDQLSVRVFAPHEMWAVKPGGQWTMVPRGGRFIDIRHLNKPLLQQENATWAFFPSDFRCTPFVVNTQTPPTCVYNPRSFELKFTEANVNLNLLILSGLLVAYACFIANGNFQRYPNTALVFTVGIIIAYVPCSYNLGYSGLILSWLFGCLGWLFVTCSQFAFSFYKHGTKRFRVPDTFTMVGTGAVLELFIGLLIVMLVMANNK